MPNRTFKPNGDNARTRNERDQNLTNETSIQRNQTRNNTFDSRRNYTTDATKQQQRINQLEKTVENLKKQKDTKKPEKMTKAPTETLTPTDIFIGNYGEYVFNDADIKKLANDCVMPPHAISLVNAKSKNFKLDKLPEDRRCRNLIIMLNFKHFNNNENDVFTAAGELTDNKQHNKAITEIRNVIKLAVTFYKPDAIFVQIAESSEKRTMFWAIVQLVCYTENYIPININPKNGKHMSEIEQKEKSYVWRARVRTVLKQNHPKVRDISKMSPEKMINY